MVSIKMRGRPPLAGYAAPHTSTPLIPGIFIQQQTSPVAAHAQRRAPVTRLAHDLEPGDLIEQADQPGRNSMIVHHCQADASSGHLQRINRRRNRHSGLAQRLTTWNRR
jgi:hypothetical protein